MNFFGKVGSILKLINMARINGKSAILLVASFLYIFQSCEVVSSVVKENAAPTTKRNADEDDQMLEDDSDETVFSISGATATLSDCDPEKGEAFHHRSQKCYPVFQKGPCGTLQLFYRSSVTPQLGRCTCIYNDEVCNIRKSADPVFQVSRPLLTAPDRRRCYYAFAQGPCSSGEWYVLDSKKRVPVCQPNPCQQPLTPTISDPAVKATIRNSELDVFWFTLNGECHQTFTQAYCGENEFVRFWGTDPRPSCVPVSSPKRSCIRRPYTSNTVKQCGVNGHECPPGGSHHILFSQGTSGVLKCDSGYRLADRKCVPYGIFEHGFQGTVIERETSDDSGEIVNKLSATWPEYSNIDFDGSSNNIGSGSSSSSGAGSPSGTDPSSGRADSSSARTRIHVDIKRSST